MADLTVVESIAALRAELRGARAARRSIGLVPTMGALHEGHLALIAAAAERHDYVAISIFVNPLQFGPNEDYERYPRDLDADVSCARAAGVALCFAPSAEEMYPPEVGPVSVDPGPLGTILEGAARPGHFAGVATVVTKLFALFGADEAFFGAKDYQQLLIVRALARALCFSTRVVAVPTVREADGLARSSRNRRLDPAERRAAAVLARALEEGRRVLESGAEPALAEAAMAAAVGREPLVELDYAVVRDAADLSPVRDSTRALRLLIAARVGSVRLIDNLDGGRRV